MASSSSSSSSSSFILLLLLLSLVGLAAGQNTTHIHFYMHDVQSGSSPTAVKVITGPNSTNGMGFGNVYIVDDLLTEGPSPTSAPVGRAQGFYAFASQGAIADTALLLTLNLVFQGGTHNGSTLAVLSRDAIFAAERELPVVGGTGSFRMARGYVLMKTNKLGSGGDAVLEWDVYVVTDPVDWAAVGAAGPAEGPGRAPPSSGSGANAAAAAGGSSPKLYLLYLVSLLYVAYACL